MNRQEEQREGQGFRVIPSEQLAQSKPQLQPSLGRRTAESSEYFSRHTHWQEVTARLLK